MDKSFETIATNLADDAHACAWLELLEHYARDPMGGGDGLSPFARDHLVTRLLGRNDFIGFLAFEGSRAVGMINCFEGFSTFAARPLLNIHDLVVRAGWRGRGIGHQLLAAAQAAARSRDCCKLTLEVLANNQPALNSYQRFGFRAYTLDPTAGAAHFMEKSL